MFGVSKPYERNRRFLSNEKSFLYEGHEMTKEERKSKRKRRDKIK